MLAKKTQKLDEIARETGLNEGDKSRLGEDIKSAFEGTGRLSRRDTIKSKQSRQPFFSKPNDTSKDNEALN